jgi:predicted alpha/beta hydrolase family esterase
MPDAAAAIESAIAMAKEKSQTPVVLLAHGCGSHMALAWMEVKGSASIDAYIGIGTGMMNTSTKDILHLRNPLEKMKFPQLDIFGSADNETVLKTAPERLGHINRASNPASRQKIIANADHNMTGKTEQLSKIITKWLNKKAFVDK